MSLFPADPEDPTNPPNSRVWYLVFEEDGMAARDKVIRLARTGAIGAHRERIADFFSGCSLETGDPVLTMPSGGLNFPDG